MAQNQQMDRRNRQGNQRPQTPREQQTPNQQITAAQKVDQIIRAIGQQRADIEAGLPANIPYARFHGAIVMAMRADPDIVDCYVPSIILAALQSAYDGLMPDKREGAFVVYNNRVQDSDGQWYSRKEVQWTPMYRGLRKKVLKTKEIIDLQSVIIYANEKYHIERGMNPVLEHEPILDDNARGEKVAVYSLAVFKNGHRTFEIMTAGDVAKVRASAKTQKIWDAWEDEMWKKSVTRRHSKQLPGGDDLVDIEAVTMFPQFATPDQVAALPAPPRPTRDQFRSIEDRSRAHVFNDFGGGINQEDRREKEPVAQQGQASEQRAEGEPKNDGAKEQAAKAEPQPEPDKADAPATEDAKVATDNTSAEAATEGGGEPEPLVIPADEAGWEVWAAGLREGIEQCQNVDAINALRTREAPRVEAAPDALNQELSNAFFDRITDLATGGVK